MRNDLQALEQRWGLAVESASFGVWDLDVAAHRVHYSPQWKAMLGYGSADEAEDTAVWRARVHPDDLGAMLHALGAHLRGETAQYGHEFRLQAADGSWRWVLSRGRVVRRDAAGQPLRAVGTLTDLTERREAEAQIAALRSARDRAEAQTLALGQSQAEFLAQVSHELRTPLNAVLGFAQLLRDGGAALNEAQRQRYVAEIERAGWALLALVDGALSDPPPAAGTGPGRAPSSGRAR